MLIHGDRVEWLLPDWPAPATVKAVVSTRNGRLSSAPFDGFNTADHVGASPQDVAQCRRFFEQHFHLQKQPQWLNQVHGIDAVRAASDGQLQTADAVYSHDPGVVCTVHTADCLPVFFCHQTLPQVALAHAGWRGLLNGVLEATLETFTDGPNNLICWLGPAISQAHFEVGSEVKAQFDAAQQVPSSSFKSSGRVSETGEHYLCDLYALARARLEGAGVSRVYGGDLCTFQDSRFFSYRQQKTTGRILSAVWIEPSF